MLGRPGPVPIRSPTTAMTPLRTPVPRARPPRRPFSNGSSPSSGDAACPGWPASTWPPAGSPSRWPRARSRVWACLAGPSPSSWSSCSSRFLSSSGWPGSTTSLPMASSARPRPRRPPGREPMLRRRPERRPLPIPPPPLASGRWAGSRWSAPWSYWRWRGAFLLTGEDPGPELAPNSMMVFPFTVRGGEEAAMRRPAPSSHTPPMRLYCCRDSGCPVSGRGRTV